MISVLRKIWATFTWSAFAAGMLSLLILGWTKSWPYFNEKFFQSPESVGPTRGSDILEPPSRIDEGFLQSLATQLADGDSKESVSALAFDPEREVLLVGHESGMVDIWDSRQQHARRGIKTHGGRVSRLYFSSDGKTFFTNSYFENTTNVWDTESGTLILSLASTRGPVVETSEVNYFIIANSAELRIFDLKSRELLPERYRDSSGVVTAFGYDLLTDQLAVGTASGGVDVWKFTNTQNRPTLERVAASQPYEVGNSVVGLKFSNYGQAVYSFPSRGSIDEWSTKTLEKIGSRQRTLTYSSSPIFLPEKGLAAMVGSINNNSDGGHLEVFNLETGKTTVIDLMENGTGVLSFVPSLSTILSINGHSIAAIDISKVR